MTTRQYREGDDEEIVELLKASFPIWAEMPNPLEYWRWKYRLSPLGTHIVVSTIGDKVVGVGHCIKLRVKLGDRALVSYYDDDYATYPEYRNKGIYKEVTNYTDKVKKEAQADFCYWITQNPIVLTKAMIHEQVSFPVPFADLVRVKDIDRFVEKYSIKDASSLKAGVQPDNLQTSFNIVCPKPENEFNLVDIDSFDERFETFWEKVAEDYDYILLRDRSYMNWRFTQNPMVEYKIKAAVSNNRVIGYVVLEIEDDEGYLVGTIFDLMVLHDRVDVASSLFDEAVKYFDSLNMDCISLTTMRGHIYQKIAYFSRFVNSPVASKAQVMFWGYNEYFYDTISVLKPEKIYFSYSDYFY